MICDFNPSGQMVRVENNCTSFAKTCKDYSPYHEIISTDFDKLGRPLITVDSSADHKNVRLKNITTYSDSAIDVLNNPAADNILNKAYSLPQIRKWLATKHGLRFTRQHTQTLRYENYNKPPHNSADKNSPTQAIDAYTNLVTDNHENTWITTGADGGALTLYKYGSDTAGNFRAAYQVRSLPPPDTATYNPGEMPAVHKTREIISRGDDYEVNSNVTYDLKGTIRTDGLEYGERKITGKTGGWQIIKYNRQRSVIPAEQFWMPIPKRLKITDTQYTDVILIDRGLVRYIFNQFEQKLYKLNYSN